MKTIKQITVSPIQALEGLMFVKLKYISTYLHISVYRRYTDSAVVFHWVILKTNLFPL